MTGQALERVAAGIPIPVDLHGRARAYCGVDHELRHRVYFALDGGRERSPFVGPSFERPRDAIRLANLLNGDPAPRPAATAIPDVPGPRKDELAIPSRVDDREPLAADHGAGPPASDPSTGVDRVCVSCGGPLPRGSRADRLTCGATCRKAASREAAGRPAAAPTSPDVDSAASDVTPTRPSTGRQLGLPLS